MAREIAVDMGTTSTQVFLRSEGVVVDDYTVVAIDNKSGEVLEIGRSALRLVSDAPDRLQAVWPMRNGAVEDNALTQRFLTRLLRSHVGKLFERTRVVLCVPSSTTPMERRSMRNGAKRAGATNAYLIEQTMAAALGGGLPVHEPVGTVVVVAGAGATEASLISLGSIVASSSIRFGSAEVDGAIKQIMRRDYGMHVTDKTAEDIKLAVSGMSTEADMMIEARGQTVMDGSTITALLEPDELQPAVDIYLEKAIEVVRECLVQAPPELSQDLFSRGIYLAGGGALLGGLEGALAESFGLSVSTIPEPDRAAVMGAGKCLEAIESLKTLFIG